ncbi:Fc.00g014710.m01.CDS01 [Cosmosporella sp. VM-42]
MAHQAHNIPWTVLASTLKLKAVNPCQHDAHNFHARKDMPDRGKKLTYFTNAFVRNALDHARCERQKYPQTYVPPKEDDIVLTDVVAKKIEATVYRWRLDHNVYDEFGSVQEPSPRGLCQHKDKATICECPLPFAERKMSAFIRQYKDNPCWWFFEENMNTEGFFNLEVVKTLLLYGEMDPILKVCTDPRIDLKSWWQKSLCQCEDPDLGWDTICRLAVDAYLVLNVLHCFPKTWDDAGSPTDDYTSIKAYQYLVRRCTMSNLVSEIPTFPHRQFFGIEKGQFGKYPRPQDAVRWAHVLKGAGRKYPTLAYYPEGLMSYEDMLNFERPFCYQAHSTDASHVRWMLCEKGLPVELANSILEKASYTPQRRLPVAGHPLHPENREELNKYLNYCWQLIVRCTMLGQALGMDMKILLANMVKNSIGDIFGCKCFKLYEQPDYEEGQEIILFK